MAKYKKLSALKTDEVRVYNTCKFSHVCKNSGRRHEYDLARIAAYKEIPEITKVFAWALYRKRHSQGHLTRVSAIGDFSNFKKFLEVRGVRKPSELNSNLLSAYAQWLKHNPALKFSSAASIYRKLSTYFIVMESHPSIRQPFVPKKNAFPKSERAKIPKVGFSEDELKKILKAVTLELREASNRLENVYERVWTGKPPPLDGVAPTSRQEANFNKGSKWGSPEYQIWWWENIAECKRLDYEDLKKLKGGRQFYLCVQPKNPHPDRQVKNKLSSFYDEIGAGENYKPKYLGRESPIKYNSPWQKKDYVLWYWENKLDCGEYYTKNLKEIDPKFYYGVTENFGTLNKILEEVGAGFEIVTADLYPYFLMLLIRTGLNPSTIHRLTIDCIKNDPLCPGKKMIDWEKFRSFQKGRSIPVKDKNETWAIKIIERVILLTARIRKPGQKELWITNGSAKVKGERVCAIQYPVIMQAAQKFAQKHELTDDKGKPLVLAGSAFRPTIAWIEYLRTEDMNYLQTLLGHKKLGTTSDYLRRVKDPVFINRRAIHQDAMFLSLTKDGGKVENIRSEVIGVDVEDFSDGLLNHCKDPLDSPIAGQKEGVFCSAGSDACFGCQNLVITAEDIKKYFCFIDFYKYLRDVGDIAEIDFESITSEKIHYWETYILPKYDDTVVHRIRKEAEINPYEYWDIAIYENERDE